MKKKTAALAIKDDLLVDLTFGSVSASLLAEFAEDRKIILRAQHERSNLRPDLQNPRRARVRSLQVIAQGGPQTICSIYKQVTSLRGFKHAHYPNGTSPIKTLVVLGFANEAVFKITKAGLTASLHNLYPKAYLALLLKSIVMDGLLQKMGDLTAFAVLEALALR